MRLRRLARRDRRLVPGQRRVPPARRRAVRPSRREAAERTGEQSDNYVRHRVSIRPDRREHPIVAGLDDFQLDTEQYWVLSDAYNDVLATTEIVHRDFDAWHRPFTVPVVWTREWGRGRVFVCTAGHRLEVLDDPSVRTIVERGLLWASR